MSDTIEIWWENWRGKRQEREFNMVIDVRKFLGTPGYPMLVMAANTDKAVPDVQKFLSIIADETGHPNIKRSLNWLQKRRWMFQQPGTRNPITYGDRDGKQARAVAIMRENPTLSLYKLRASLMEKGISRSKEWIRRHRCD